MTHLSFHPRFPDRCFRVVRCAEPEREPDELSRNPGAGLALQFSVPAQLQRSSREPLGDERPRSRQAAAARFNATRCVPPSSDRPPYTAATTPAGPKSRA
jgi:hypothetical protein